MIDPKDQHEAYLLIADAARSCCGALRLGDDVHAEDIYPIQLTLERVLQLLGQPAPDYREDDDEEE
jgi:hypothetical protein